MAMDIHLQRDDHIVHVVIEVTVAATVAAVIIPIAVIIVTTVTEMAVAEVEQGTLRMQPSVNNLCRVVIVHVRDVGQYPQ